MSGNAILTFECNLSSKSVVDLVKLILRARPFGNDEFQGVKKLMRKGSLGGT